MFDLTPAEAKHLITVIEVALRDKGLSPLTISGVWGAGFASALSDLPAEQRHVVVAAHQKLLQQTLELLAIMEAKAKKGGKHAGPAYH